MSNSLSKKSFSNPDLVKEPLKTHAASVNLGVATATKNSVAARLEVVRMRETTCWRS